MLHNTRINQHHRTHAARLQLVALFNFLVVGDTTITHAPLPVGTLSRPSDRVFMFESSSTRIIFDNVPVADMRNMLMSHLLHGYTRGITLTCGTCGALQVSWNGHRGINKQGCLHCTGRTRPRQEFK